MALPQFTPEQRQANLQKAAQTRKARAQLKAALKAGEEAPGDVLSREDDVARKLTVKAFLESLPGWGKAKAEHALEHLGVAPTRRIGGLGKNQKESLLELIQQD